MNLLKRNSRGKHILSLLLLSGLIISPQNLFAQEADNLKDEVIDTAIVEDVYLITGELQMLKVDGLTRLSLTDPAVADFVDVTEEEILVIGKKIGKTVLFIWDSSGKRAITIHVLKTNLN